MINENGEMDPYIKLVRLNALHWLTYKLWTLGDKEIRGFEMGRSMRDLQLYACLYRSKCKVQGRIPWA